jgi:hypothetical protein
MKNTKHYQQMFFLGNRSLRNVSWLRAAAPALLAVIWLGGYARAATKTWDGGGTSGLWSDAVNWNAAIAATGDSATFDGTTRLNNTNDFVTALVGITFNSGAGAFVLNGNGITLGGNITDSSTTLQTINFNLALDANRTVTAVSGGELDLAGNISGAFTLTKDNTGRLALSGNNSGITVAFADTSSGTIALRSATALGATTTLSVPSGDALELGGGGAPNLAISGVTLTLNGTGLSSGGALRNVTGNNSWGGAITMAGDVP